VESGVEENMRAERELLAKRKGIRGRGEQKRVLGVIRIKAHYM
jgi:hypothetical protein